jgi:hypothetical protein
MGNQTGPPRPLAALKPLAAFAGWGTLLTLALSTQLLFQPFVWRNWPWDEVLSAWFATRTRGGAPACPVGSWCS